MIPQQHRYTLGNEPRYHGWENAVWDEAGVLHLHSSRHPGRLCVDMDGAALLLFQAEDPAAADMLADVFDVPPGEAHACGMDALKDTLTAMAEALAAPRQPRPTTWETEAEATVKQRRHQQLYRDRLLALWDNCCAVTGCALPELLVASHAKPWAASTPSERLDPYNGFPLEARFDRLFDQGLITFMDDGQAILSPRLTPELCQQLHLSPALHLRFRPDPRHLPYLRYHREHVFQDPGKPSGHRG